MTATLYRLPLAGTASASSEAAGYLASNAPDSAVSKPWRSNTTAASWLQIDLGSAQTIAGVSISDTNGDTIAVTVGNSSPPGTSAGFLLAHAGLAASVDGPDARRRGLVAVAGSYRYIRLSFSGTPTDALGYWRAGAVTVWGASWALPVPPLYPLSIECQRGQDNVTLPNGSEIAIARGIERERMTISFKPTASQTIEQLVRYARAGAVWLDLGVASEPALQWPIHYPGPSVTRRKQGYNREPVELVVVERG